MAVLVAVSTNCSVDERELSEARLAKAASLRQPDDRARCLRAGWALDAALRTVGLRERSVAIAPGEHGKPCLQEHPHWHFNLSHSGEWAVCALSDAPIGVDIEQWRSMDYERLARRWFSPGEVQALTELPLSERQSFFFRLWTRKESWLKARGLGLSGLSAAELTTAAFREYPLPGYSLTVCTDGCFPERLMIME